jgi:hypothetical protein
MQEESFASKRKTAFFAAAAMPPHPTALLLQHHSASSSQHLAHHFSWLGRTGGQGLPIAPAVSRLSASWGGGLVLLVLAADAAVFPCSCLAA